jgi:hypothetical protein
VQFILPFIVGIDADSADAAGQSLLHWLAGGVELPRSSIRIDGRPTTLKWCAF